jgi:hypothetical protein
MAPVGSNGHPELGSLAGGEPIVRLVLGLRERPQGGTVTMELVDVNGETGPIDVTFRDPIASYS